MPETAISMIASAVSSTLRSETFRELAQDRAGLLDVDLHRVVAKVGVTDEPEHDKGVRNCGARAAAPIAGRSRPRAGAFRPDLQHALAVDPSDGATAFSDR